MGAWGNGIFENDDALDWIVELEQADDYSVIFDALNTIEDNADDYLDASDCFCALAAAEVVACIHSKQTNSLPDELSEWLKSQEAMNPKLITKARNATQAILSDSELKDLWAESDDYSKWKSELENVISRLEF